MDGLFDDLIPPPKTWNVGIKDGQVIEPNLFAESPEKVVERPAPKAAALSFDDLIPKKTDEASEESKSLFGDLVPVPKEDHGIWEELKAGSMAGLRSIAEGAKQAQQLAANEPVEAPAEVPEGERAMAAPFDFPSMPNKETLPKAAYHLAQGMVGSAPEMAGGMVGGAIGSSVEPGVGTAIGAGLGAGTVYLFRQIAPTFAAELKGSPDDPDGAWSRAVKKTTIGGAGTAAAFAAFGINPFTAGGPIANELKNLAFQAFGLQPAIAVGEKAITNATEGKPATEGLGSTYAESAISTLAPYAAMRPLHGNAKAATEEGKPPPAPPEGGQPPGGDEGPPGGEFSSPVPEFIKEADAGIPTDRQPKEAAKTFKIDNPEAYGLDVANLPPEHAAAALRAAQATEEAAAAARTALADTGTVEPAIAAKHPIPEFAHETGTSEPLEKPPQRGQENVGRPIAPAGGEGPRVESGQRGQEGARSSPAVGEGVRGRPPAEEAAGEPAGGTGGRGTEAARPESARPLEPVQPSPQAAGDSEVSLAKFRRDISKATGKKGVPVYDHGEGAGYDPLLDAIHVGRDVPVHEQVARGIADLAKPPAPEKWRDTPIDATVDDGSAVQTTAGHAADAIGQRIKRAMAVLECMR